jgi:hypothetical protein
VQPLLTPEEQRRRLHELHDALGRGLSGGRMRSHDHDPPPSMPRPSPGSRGPS